MMIGVDSDGAECETSLPDSGPHLRTTTQVPEPHIVNDILKTRTPATAYTVSTFFPSFNRGTSRKLRMSAPDRLMTFGLFVNC